MNLLLLGLTKQIDAVYDAHGKLALWSYRITNGTLLPTRYGTSYDVQLWSATDLAVQFALSTLPR